MAKYYYEKYQLSSSYYSYYVTGSEVLQGTVSSSGINGHTAYSFIFVTGIFSETGERITVLPNSYTNIYAVVENGTSLVRYNYQGTSLVHVYKTTRVGPYSGYDYYKGAYITTIIAEDGTYPANSYSSGYWWIKKGIAETATLTSPNGGETFNASESITWTSTAPSTVKFHIQLSVNNKATWSDIIALTAANARNYTYNFSSLLESSVCAIRIRASDGTTFGPWDESDQIFTIQHNVAPLAPSNLSPSGINVNRIIVQRLSWQHNDQNSNDPQSKFDLRWGVDGVNWNIITQTTTNQYYDFNSNVFPEGQIIWQVRTYDYAGLVGPYSSQATFIASTPSSAPTILSPLSAAIVPISRPTIQWSGDTQISYQVQVYNESGSILWDTNEVASTNKAITCGIDLSNGTKYSIKVRYKNSSALWTEWSQVSITVVYAEPGISVITAIPKDGYMQLSISTGTWPVIATIPIYTGSGISSIINPTVSAGVTNSHNWEAGCVTSLTDGGIFDIKVDGNIIGQVSAGDEFAYEGCTFTINTRAGSSYIAGDKYAWNTEAIKVIGNDIYRSEFGDSNWVRIAANIESSGSYLDYTVSSETRYLYYIHSYGSNSTFRISEVTEGTLYIKGAFIHDVMDAGNTIIKLQHYSQRGETWQAEGTLMQYAGRKKPAVEYGDAETNRIEVTVPLSKDGVEYTKIKTISFNKNTVCYRDERGRKVFGALMALPITDERSFGYTVRLSIDETDYLEEGV